jgi:hypothetical protein
MKAEGRTSIMAYSPSTLSWQNGQVMTAATRLLSDWVRSIAAHGTGTYCSEMQDSGKNERQPCSARFLEMGV